MIQMGFGAVTSRNLGISVGVDGSSNNTAMLHCGGCFVVCMHIDKLIKLNNRLLRLAEEKSSETLKTKAKRLINYKEIYSPSGKFAERAKLSGQM